jgi:hypothetical protein
MTGQVEVMTLIHAVWTEETFMRKIFWKKAVDFWALSLIFDPLQ